MAFAMSRSCPGGRTSVSSDSLSAEDVVTPLGN
jgi:hypothetical protein